MFTRMSESDDEQFFDALDESDDIQREWDLMMEKLDENIAESGRLKQEANDFFKKQEYSAAEPIYQSALSVLPSQQMCENYEKFRQKDNSEFSLRPEPANKERAVLHGNLSATQKYLEKFKEAIENASAALRLDPEYLKVRIRRAELYELNDQPHESLEDWKLVLEANPSHKPASRAMSRLPPLIEAKNEKLKEEMFDGLKKLGNMCLKPFGLSTNNFQLNQNENGSYSVNFQQ